ncbi:UNVERIFIED_ORG: excalibur calcium-binding domain-containing protein [Bacillus sp. AZ43]
MPLPPPPSPPFCESPSTPTPTPTPTPKPNQPGYYQPGQQHTGYQYRNCDEARAAGAAPVYSGQYGYGSHLDADYDGVGCEESYGHYATTHPVAQHVAYDQAGKLAYTGVTVQPLLIWGAALLLSGGWLIRSSRRSA